MKKEIKRNEPTFPTAIFDDTTPSEFKVMLCLYANYCEEKQCTHVSRSYIAEECGMSVSSVERILRTLADKDLIRVQHHYTANGRQLTNSYQLIYRSYPFHESKLCERIMKQMPV